MPRSASETSAVLADLHRRLQNVIAATRAEGHATALNEIRSRAGGGAPMKRGPGRPKGSKNQIATATTGKKPRRKGQSSWAGLTPAQHLARVNAIREGRGLPPKSA